ncbi:hypothetical protein RVN83_25685 [Streptomyces sp. PU10]|uniref:hypothetical protein n=1 Tax=Streptomyces sp. PU10 TaxID=3062780 RepID=UPI0028FC40DD|nr:hypothetical protein [Streptomyces sp. PU10]MDU0256433.1 hypothetical protein [Streptomyces sp. PU10]
MSRATISAPVRSRWTATASGALCWSSSRAALVLGDTGGLVHRAEEAGALGGAGDPGAVAAQRGHQPLGGAVRDG